MKKEFKCLSMTFANTLGLTKEFNQGNLKKKEHSLHWKNALRLRFCVPNVVCLYDLKVSIVKHFFCGLNQIWIWKLRETWLLIIFYSYQYLKYLKYKLYIARLEQAPPMLPYSEHLQAIDSSFVTITKPLSNKIGGKICER